MNESGVRQQLTEAERKALGGQLRPGDFGVPEQHARAAQDYAARLVAEERERCAKLCDEVVTETVARLGYGDECSVVASNLAAAIRKGTP
jgi:hypothetical protein